MKRISRIIFMLSLFAVVILAGTKRAHDPFSMSITGHATANDENVLAHPHRRSNTRTSSPKCPRGSDIEARGGALPGAASFSAERSVWLRFRTSRRASTQEMRVDAALSF